MITYFLLLYFNTSCIQKLISNDFHTNTSVSQAVGYLRKHNEFLRKEKQRAGLLHSI